MVRVLQTFVLTITTTRGRQPTQVFISRAVLNLLYSSLLPAVLKVSILSIHRHIWYIHSILRVLK